MKKYILNPLVSFLEKNGVYAIYVNFNFLFLKDQAADLFRVVIEKLKSNKSVEEIDNKFLEYLIAKNIIQEVKNENR